ncbi:hypothetical protein OJ996_23545 [Luteolibacter sp. GHJ8]|uniref:Uncharacterized protein n=1 Tax=Luteolibacter rhizosphaerae TaxID=2989719 RepID=A0ABT3G9R0_9BACT|nr:hypothetical protein [Luteolibacter rhizosphaerae]MCW1916582.1 hypothetical protein [Luteolibacter rhizosphaerae]
MSTAAPPATEPLYRCMTKGVKGAAESFEYGMSWVTSRRARLKVFPDRLECGDWAIPYAAITDGVLFETRQMFIPCYILKVRTATECYQFGLNGNKFWRSELPFPVTRQKGRLKYSAVSIAMRVVLLICLAWYWWSSTR